MLLRVEQATASGRHFLLGGLCLALKSLEARHFRTDSQWLAAASVVDIPVSPWEDLITLTILDLHEMETAHCEAPTVQQDQKFLRWGSGSSKCSGLPFTFSVL